VASPFKAISRLRNRRKVKAQVPVPVAFVVSFKPNTLDLERGWGCCVVVIDVHSMVLPVVMAMMARLKTSRLLQPPNRCMRHAKCAGNVHQTLAAFDSFSPLVRVLPVVMAMMARLKTSQTYLKFSGHPA
jgi:hypothetical protein